MGTGAEMSGLFLSFNMRNNKKRKAGPASGFPREEALNGFWAMTSAAVTQTCFDLAGTEGRACGKSPALQPQQQ